MTAPLRGYARIGHVYNPYKPPRLNMAKGGIMSANIDNMMGRKRKGTVEDLLRLIGGK